MDFDLNMIPSQRGKIAIVTGANTGLGYETTLGLAKRGMKVVMACRNLEKAEQAKAQMMAEVPDAALAVMHLDLSELGSVRSFAQKFLQDYSQLNLLINNAGIMFPPYSATADGFESQFAVNYLSHFLLTALLIDLMPDRTDSRVVSLSSNAHQFGRINFEDLQSEQSYSAVGAYGQSKLACLMFARELQRRLTAQGKQILSVCAHPGLSETELPRHIPGWVQMLLRLTPLPLMSHSPQAAALPTLYAALGSDVQGGEYFGPQGLFETRGEPGRAVVAKHAQDQAAAERLWRVSGELIGREVVVA